MEIFRPGPEHIPALQQLARSTWEATYSSIISREQIDYMLNLFYDADLMREQMADPAQLFFAAREEDTLLGYAHLHPAGTIYKLSKLYVYPQQHKGGVGKTLLQHAEEVLRALSISRLTLNVNRNNPALGFYERMGFRITETVDIALGPYWLNDYVMEKDLG